MPTIDDNRVQGRIHARKEDHFVLEAIGIKLGPYNERNREFVDCEMDILTVASLNALYPRFLWAVTPVMH